jgi:hypothetical protein
MADTEETQQDEERPQQEGEEPDLQSSAQEAQERHESAQKKMNELEEADEVPTNLEDWPDDEAKYVTFGGPEGDHSYEDGPEKKLGPSSLERHGDGSISIEGDEVDDPDEHKADPVPGGPTDPNVPEMRGERKKREKIKEMYGEDELPDALREKASGSDEDSDSDEQDGSGSRNDD